MSNFEDKVAAGYEAEGWKVYRNGWPDMLLVRKNADGKLEVKAAEVKSKTDDFRGNQLKVCVALSLFLPVREVCEGIGYGDATPINGAFELIVDETRVRYSYRKPHRISVEDWLLEK